MTSGSTRQPPGADGSGTAARPRPASSSSRIVAPRLGAGRRAPSCGTRPDRRPARRLDRPVADRRRPRGRACGAAREPRPRRVVQREERGPNVVALDEAHREQRGLRRDRVRGALEVRAEQRQPAGVDAPGPVPSPRVPGRDSAAIAPGTSLLATETTPSPPMARTRASPRRRPRARPRRAAGRGRSPRAARCCRSPP